MSMEAGEIPEEVPPQDPYYEVLHFDQIIKSKPKEVDELYISGKEPLVIIGEDKRQIITDQTPAGFPQADSERESSSLDVLKPFPTDFKEHIPRALSEELSAKDQKHPRETEQETDKPKIEETPVTLEKTEAQTHLEQIDEPLVYKRFSFEGESPVFVTLPDETGEEKYSKAVRKDQQKVEDSKEEEVEEKDKITPKKGEGEEEERVDMQKREDKSGHRESTEATRMGPVAAEKQPKVGEQKTIIDESLQKLDENSDRINIPVYISTKEDEEVWGL